MGHKALAISAIINHPHGQDSEEHDASDSGDNVFSFRRAAGASMSSSNSRVNRDFSIEHSGETTVDEEEAAWSNSIVSGSGSVPASASSSVPGSAPGTPCPKRAQGTDDTDDEIIVNNRNQNKGKQPMTNYSVDERANEEQLSAQPSKNLSNQQPAAAVSSSEDEELEIDHIVSHRVNEGNATVEFRVKWKDAGASYESEFSLQAQVPTLVYDYWHELGGRQAATGLDTFHVFKLLKSRKDGSSFLVQWVGYRAIAGDTTWELRSLLQKISPGALADFEVDQAAKEAAARAAERSKAAKKRGVARKIKGKMAKKARRA